MSFADKFSNLGAPGRVWAVSAVHDSLAALQALHAALFERLSPGDRLVYTGNYLAAENPVETIDELLHFRRSLLSCGGVQAQDIVYLRGAAEDLWEKILCLQFNISPRQALEWVATHHPATARAIAGYGGSFAEGFSAIAGGIPCIARWTAQLRTAQNAHPGHDKFFSSLRRAAFTEKEGGNNILFVHAGVDPSLPLTEQGDNFFWAYRKFSDMPGPYAPFRAVVRGADPEFKGLVVGPGSVSLGGAHLTCAEMNGDGDILNILAA